MRQRLAMLFKLLHILIVFLLALYVVASLPPVLALALCSATHLFRRICSVVCSPALVFAALNASVLLLSSFAPRISPSPHVQSTHLLNASGLGEIVVTADAEFEDISDNAAGKEEEDEEQVSAATDDVVDADEVIKMMTFTAVEHEADRNKCHRYSRSGLEMVDDDDGRSESEPERCLEIVRAAAEVGAGVVETTQKIEERGEVVEELSIAEFNRIIEAFLEKQKKFHYQENLSILV
uniref:DUF4408 domain-containing protein n=1 Tax=Kalanchoe fedtschenkoi TaxID=63787 RepID=A0A7N1A8K4_KALFE